MEEQYIDAVEPKQPEGPPLRRGFYREEHEVFRQPAAVDLKYPFPQANIFPPNLSIRGLPLKNTGPFGDNLSGNEHNTADPRYVPQEFVLLVREFDDKRYKSPYNFPLGQGSPVNPGTNVYNLSGAGTNSLSGLTVPPIPLAHPKTKEEDKLVTPIPPLHVQRVLEHSRKDGDSSDAHNENTIHTKCSRCKKDFAQTLVMPLGKGKTSEPKVFKLCFHCRDLQRQRSRRWQKKTKDKQGACRRCGSDIPVDQQRFVLCPQCRKSLRVRKANRAAQGRCVHCSGPITSHTAKEESPDGESSEDPDSRRASVSGSATASSFKVCQRCRENDKIRRTNLERMGNCNRCAKALDPEEQGKHKVCFTCRQKKKKLGSLSVFNSVNTSEGASAHPPQLPLAQSMHVLQGPQHFQPPPHLHSAQPLHGSHVPPQPGQPMSHLGEAPPGMMIPPMGYMPIDQNGMLMHHPAMNGYSGTMALQEPHIGYGQQMQPVMLTSGEMYKPPMTQLPQLQPHMDQGYPQYIGYPPAGRGGIHYSNNRI